MSRGFNTLLVTGALLAAGCANNEAPQIAGHDPAVSPSVTPALSIDAVNGHTLDNGKVTDLGSGMKALPSIESLTGPWRLEAEDEAVIKGLGDTRTLSEWRLCSIELRAAGAALRGIIEAVRNNPDNAPFHPTPEEAANSLNSLIAAHEPFIEAFDAAAVRADSAGIPCTDPENKHDLDGHFSTISVTYDGKLNTFRIPDYAVMSTIDPVEYYVAEGIGPDDIAKDYEEQLTIPIADAPVYPKAGLRTYSEQRRAQALSRLTVVGNMLKEAGVTG